MNSRVEFFFELMQMLKIGDYTTNTSIDNVTKQTLFSEKTTTEEFFKLVIDQPAFISSDDHLRIRTMLMDWYASHKSMISGAKNTTDPFSLSDDALNELLLSFAFPYPRNFVNRSNKIYFLLDLVNLYNKKGTPESIINACQYFGLSNVDLSEWWIRTNADGDFIARSQIVLPLSKRENSDYYREMSFEEFTSDDPHWYMSLDELESAYESSSITLPSITPYFSIEAYIDEKYMEYANAIISRKLQESYEYWLVNGELKKDIYFDRYGIFISMLELILALGYVFDGTDGIGKKFLYYQKQLDTDGDGVDDRSYETILAEYDDVVHRYQSRDARDAGYKKYLSTFVGDTEDYFLQTESDHSTILDVINSSFLEKLTDEVDSGFAYISTTNNPSVLESLMSSLDGYLSETLGIIDFSFSFHIDPSITYKRIKPVINFFKPYRARMRDFSIGILINNPLLNSCLEKDKFTQLIHQYAIDHYYERGLLGYGRAHDIQSYFITQYVESKLVYPFDRNVKDDMSHLISNRIDDELNVHDSFEIEIGSMTE